MRTFYSESEILNLLKQLDNVSAKKRESAILEIRRKQIVDERIILVLMHLASSDSNFVVRNAAKYALIERKFQSFIEDSRSLNALLNENPEKLYWPPEGLLKNHHFIRQKRKYTLQTTSSLSMAKAKYVGGHPLISQSREVVVSLTETNFIIYSIDSQSEISVLSSIPLLHIIKVEEQMRDKNNNTFQQSPFLTIEFKLQGYQYAASFESFEKGSSPQDWANKIIAQQYQLRTASSSTDE